MPAALARTTSAWVAMSLLAVGCAGTGARLGEGARCTRTIECGPGLVCNAGACSSDRTGFGMGMVPVPGMDAGPVDAPLSPDAYVEGEDAFVEPPDAFIDPVTDAWAPDAWAPDAWMPGTDAYTVPVDAYSPPPADAFTPPVDAHTPSAPDAHAEPPDANEPDAAS